MEEERKEKRRAFTKQIRIKEKSLSWLRKNKGSYTMAGKLDEIINIYKKTYANETVREMSRERVETREDRKHHTINVPNVRI